MGLRVFLFLMTNLSILVVFFIIMSIFDIERYTGQGSLYSLMFTALFFGFSGSILSLLISKWVAKKTMGVMKIHINF